MGRGIVGCTQQDQEVSVFFREEAGPVGRAYSYWMRSLDETSIGLEREQREV